MKNGYMDVPFNVVTAVTYKCNLKCKHCYAGSPDFDCSQLVEMTIDHIIPISQGGGNVCQNLQPMCKECNQQKRDLRPSELLLGREWFKSVTTEHFKHEHNPYTHNTNQVQCNPIQYNTSWSYQITYTPNRKPL